MKIGVITKFDALSSLRRKDILSFLSSKGIIIKEFDDSSKIDDDCDRVLAFGGDGTMLDVASHINNNDIPILGINLGNLGFLTSIEADCSNNQILSILQNGNIVERSMLSVCVLGNYSKALNEVVIKSKKTKPIFVDVYVDGKRVDTYHGDGVIISTPTGTTAYSQSCGGPILSPQVNAFSIVPICAHSLSSRPIVINDKSAIDVKILQGFEAMMCVDGNYICDVDLMTNVYIKKADCNAKFLTSKNDDYYHKLFQKMNKWGSAQHC